MGHLDIHNQYNNQFAEQEELNPVLVLYGKVLQYGFSHIKAVKGCLSSSPEVLILDLPQVMLDVMDSGLSV